MLQIIMATLAADTDQKFQCWRLQEQFQAITVLAHF
jgi:hypothetical protein